MNHVPSTQLLLIEREKEVTGYAVFCLLQQSGQLP